MTLSHLPRQLRCYRLYVFSDYDEEVIWARVQSWGGHISIRGDCIDFWVPEPYVAWFLLSFPDLQAQPDLDYV